MTFIYEKGIKGNYYFLNSLLHIKIRKIKLKKKFDFEISHIADINNVINGIFSAHMIYIYGLDEAFAYQKLIKFYLI